jgi:hypothetical protein
MLGRGPQSRTPPTHEGTAVSDGGTLGLQDVAVRGPDEHGGNVERLVKSPDRVRDIGEVFTPAATVSAMLDLIPDEMWQPHPSATFLEPSCGDGNFLVAVLRRKLENIDREFQLGNLSAGKTSAGAQFHAMEALASIYAVDISPDNVIGGTPGHELGARERMLSLLIDWHRDALGILLVGSGPLLKSAKWIVDRNVLVGNMLPTTADGRPSGRENLPLVDYTWLPEAGTVSVATTSLRTVMALAKADTTGVMSLFDRAEPERVWRGIPGGLHEAPIQAPEVPRELARNGNRWRAR